MYQYSVQDEQYTVLIQSEGTEKNVKDLLEKGETVKLKGFKTKGGKSFESKLSVKDGKVQFQFN